MALTVANAAVAFATCAPIAFATESLLMTLDEYLNEPDALTVTGLRMAARVKSDAQIRQWRYGYSDRLPGPENCVAIERATSQRVRRWDLRPKDWHRIWPELIGAEGAPAVPVEEVRDAA